MLSKVLAVVQSKAALAVLGVVLVGGGSTAAAYAATGHQLPLIGNQAAATEKPEATHDASGNHAHTVSIEGVLKGYDSGAGTITVSANAMHSDDSKPEATEHPDATAHPDATEKPEATAHPEATEKPDASKTTTATTVTVTVNAKTTINGENVSALADLGKNIGHRVQVQADKQSDGSLVAWKVTVQGADGQDGSGQSGSGQSGDDSHSGDGQTVQQHTVLGTITSVGSNSFVVKLADGSTKTVTVNGQTQYRGAVHGFGDLKANQKVGVVGTAQSDGTFLAAAVAVMTA